MISGMLNDDRLFLKKQNTTQTVYRLTVALTLILLVCAPTGVRAEGVKLAVLLQPATPGELLTTELIEARRKEVAESPDLSDDAKKKADDHLKVAADGLKRISELAATAAQFKADTDDVQQRVRDRRRRLTDLQSLKAEVPKFATLPELEQERSKKDVQLTELKTLLAQIEVEPTARANRRKEIRALLLSAAQRAADIEKQLGTPPPPDEPALLSQARLTELRARRLLIDAEQPALVF